MNNTGNSGKDVHKRTSRRTMINQSKKDNNGISMRRTTMEASPSNILKPNMLE